MTDELKQLIEDAAKLLGLTSAFYMDGAMYAPSTAVLVFSPLEPECGDLMKVAMAAELMIDFEGTAIFGPLLSMAALSESFERGDHQSLALAILRAASAVLKAREGERDV